MRAADLDKTLMNNVVTLRFTKRTNGERRLMICTKSPQLLNTPEGRSILGWYPPTGQLPYNPRKYNLCTVWDIEKRAYRHVCCDNVQVSNRIKADIYLKMLRSDK